MSNLKCIVCTLKCKSLEFQRKFLRLWAVNVHQCQFILHCFGNAIFKTEWSLSGYFPRVLWEQLSPQAALKAVWQQACGQSLAFLVIFDSLCPSHLLLPWIDLLYWMSLSEGHPGLWTSSLRASSYMGRVSSSWVEPLWLGFCNRQWSIVMGMWGASLSSHWHDSVHVNVFHVTFFKVVLVTFSFLWLFPSGMTYPIGLLGLLSLAIWQRHRRLCSYRNPVSSAERKHELRYSHLSSGQDCPARHRPAP